MSRATKIVATLGPASSDAEVLERMIRAGVDVVRLNFSHGTAQDHIDRADLVRERRRRRSASEVAIMADLQGPKIRVGKFEDGKTMLEPGDKLRPRRRAATELGTSERVGLDYKELPRDVRPGDMLLLNDGLIVLMVERVRGEEVHTTRRRRRRAVEQQGHQQGRRRPDRAGADRQGHGGHQDRDGVPGRLPRGVLPEERDRHGDGAPARPTSPASRGGHKPQLIAKIERSEAIPALEEILRGVATASWSRAATSRSKSATRPCRRCRSA